MKSNDESMMNWLDTQLEHYKNDPSIPGHYIRETLGKCRAQLRKLMNRKSASGMRSMQTAPKDGRYVLLVGPSGYNGVKYRVSVCRYDPRYKHAPWRDYANDAFLDSGGSAVGWLPYPFDK